MKTSLFTSFLLLSLFSLTIAGTTGKITGKVVDAQTGESLPGANIVLQGTSLGAAADLSGNYVILNVPPGNYKLTASMIGYTPSAVTDVRVNIDLTTRIDYKMQASVVELGDEVTVVAERPVVVKDISASQANIQSEQVEVLPVQRVQDVVGLQPGIIGTLDDGIQIRGGDQDETAFMVDGFTLRDERNNTPYTAIALSSIQDIQIQTGGFSAEYGNIRSGIINVVTKEGSLSQYGGTFTLRYSPAQAKHFGPSGFARDSYWLRPFLDDEVAWTGTNNGAWSENMKKQFPEFEGWNAISERLLQDNNPDNDLSPQAAQQLFKWQHRRQGDLQDPDYTLDFGFGGPVPIVSRKLGDLRFFFAHRQEQNSYLIRLSRNGFNDRVTQLKLTSNIARNMKLTLSGLYGQIRAVTNSQVGDPSIYFSPESVADELSQRSFINSIMFVPDFYAPTRIRRVDVAAKFTHTLSSRTFYDVQVERLWNSYKTRPQRLRDTETVVRIFGDNFAVDEAPFGFMPFPSSGIDGLRMGVGMSGARDSTRITTTSFRFDLTSQVNNNNLLKTGAEFIVNDHKARFGGVDITLPAGRPQSRWDRKPVRAAAYLQDKIEFQGLIANLGFRLDYSDPGGQWFDLDIFDPFFTSSFVTGTENQFTQVGTDKQLYLSPRLGISHPITDNSKLFFNYGHFYSTPRADRLFLVQRTNDASVQEIGSPNLKLSRTKAYEIGFEQNLYDKFLLRVAGFYKDIDNQPNEGEETQVQVLSSDSRVNYLLAEDNFFEDIRGLEVSVEKRMGRWMTGFLNYTFLVEKEGFFDPLRIFQNPAEQRAFDRQSNESKEKSDRPKARPFFNGNVTIRTPRDFGPKLGGLGLLNNWQINFLTAWRAGAHTTWTRGRDPAAVGIRNNVQRPDIFNVDLRMSKSFRMGGRTVRFFLDINNLLNNKIFNFDSSFSDGQDFRDYMDSLLWPEDIGQPLGYTQFGNDRIGDLRPEGVEFDALEANPNNDPGIADRNQVRRDTKSYIDNPNLRWLYYLNPRDVHVGFRLDL